MVFEAQCLLLDRGIGEKLSAEDGTRALALLEQAAALSHTNALQVLAAAYGVGGSFPLDYKKADEYARRYEEARRKEEEGAD
jgi:TPR repeat protein